MLGLSSNGNNWKHAVGNFIVMVGMQAIFELYGMLGLNRFPEPYEIYGVVITSLATTAIFYGYNKIKKEPEK